MLAAALAALLPLQLVVTRGAALPDAGAVHPFTLDPARPAPLLPDPAILARPLLSGAPVGVGAVVARGPLGGARAVGIMVRGRRRTGFVQAADGGVVSLAPGDVYRGWRLAAVGGSALVFRRGGETATLAVAGSARPPQVPDAETAPR